MGLVSSQISTKTMVPLCRQLATSYSAGIPIIRALELVADNTNDRAARNVLNRMGDELRNGASLGQSAHLHAKQLPPIFIELLASGEVGGRLDIMLADLADYHEDRLAMQRQIVRAAIYPFVQLLAAWFLGSWSLGWVKAMHFGTGKFDLRGYGAHYLRFQTGAAAIFAAVVVVCVILARLGVFKWVTGVFSTFIWPIAPVTRWFALARFFRTLSLLLGSGLGVVHSIERAAAVVGNPYISRDLLKAVPLVQGGASLSESFKASRHLTPTAREMLLVGEQSGNLDASLHKAAEYHQTQASHALKVATTILGVLVALGIAVLIGYIVISFYTNFYGGMMNDLGF